MAILAVCQTLKLSARFGIRDGLAGIFKDFPLRWARAFAWRIRASSAISETV